MKRLGLWDRPATTAEKVRNAVIGALGYFVADVGFSILIMHRIAWTTGLTGMIVFFGVFLVVVRRKA